MVEGQNKFGTSPVRNAYFAMGNSNLSQSLQNVDGFIHSANYPSQQNILESEWGSVQNVRFLLSSIGSTSSNDSFLGNTVYNTFVAGRFYARVKSLLIDLELWLTDNKAEGASHRERLSEENSFYEYATV